MRRYLLLLLCFIASRGFAADCATQKYSFTQEGDVIYVKAGSGITTTNESMLSAAVSAWNNSCAGEGTAFPKMYTSSVPGYKVTVNFVNGDGTRCGKHEAFGSPEPTSSVITIYATYSGVSCEPYSDTLAHELGHVYGLGEAQDPAGACAHTIMGGRAPGETRTITSEVCDQVNANWETSDELPPSDDPGTDVPCEPNTDCSAPPPPNSPVILNLGSGTYELTGASDSVLFDIDGDGDRDNIGWTARATRQAFLVLDLNNNGTVDNGTELFGNHTLTSTGDAAPHGFAALASYDDNGDGVISGADRVWSKLILWFDFNHDAAMQESEISTPTREGVTACGFESHWTGRRDSHGNLFSYQATLTTISGKRPYYDIFFVGY